jgi:hypothetical protein
MKIGYLLILVVFIFLAGCSSAYKVSDFDYKDLFYGEFNRGARDNTIKITLSNDSTYNWQYGGRIEDDTLVLSGNKNNYNYIPLIKIKKLSYKKSLPGFGIGFLVGIPVGFILGQIMAFFTTGLANNQSVPIIVSGVITGPILGGILGSILGWDYVYIFNF